MAPSALGDDELPSLLRRSHLGSTYDHDVRFENRNAEDVHRDALAAALAEHERIREIALRAYELNELRQEQERLHQHAAQEEERVRIEIERAHEECRLRDIENKKKQIPVPAPRAKTPPPRAPSPPPVRAVQPPKPPPSDQTPPTAQRPQAQPPTTTPKQTGPVNFVHAAAQKPAPTTQPSSQDATRSAPAPVQPPKNNSSHTLPHVERYAEIHQTLKKLRAMIVTEGKQNQPFKKKTGEMRRAIRTSMGQLTGEKGSNKQPVSPHSP
jgi:nucleoporin GLE1